MAAESGSPHRGVSLSVQSLLPICSLLSDCRYNVMSWLSYTPVVLPSPQTVSHNKSSFLTGFLPAIWDQPTETK